VTREEFSDLALSYLEEIAAFARRLTGNTADADDLVQATVLAVGEIPGHALEELLREATL
jgi:DNA-directed RNA polymerase specialized sigma24 family protein